jgi:hypothetical protein
MKVFFSFVSFVLDVLWAVKTSTDQDKDEAPLRYRARSMLRRAGNGKQS